MDDINRTKFEIYKNLRLIQSRINIGINIGV